MVDNPIYEIKETGCKVCGGNLIEALYLGQDNKCISDIWKMQNEESSKLYVCDRCGLLYMK